MLAPLAAVLLFLAAIVSAFGYLRLEEMDREQEAVKRDVEYAQQRVRLRLLERQEQLMRIARDISNKEVDAEEFVGRAESMVSQYPELQALTWIDERRRIKASYAAPSVANNQLRAAGEVLRPGETESIYSLARDLQQPVYSQPAAGSDGTGLLQLHIPLTEQGRFAGVILGEYSIDGLLRYGVPAEVSAKYAVALLDGKSRRAGRQLGAGPQSGHAAAALGGAGQRIRGAGLAGGQRPHHPRAGLPHLAGRDRQRPVLAGRRAERDDRLDADRQLAPHAPPHAGAAGAGGRDQLPPRHGELHADRHARARHAGPHHLRERRVLPDDRLERGRTGGPHAALPLLARGRPRTAGRAPGRRAARPHHAGRLPGARQAQGRQPLRRAPVRLAADRRQGPPDRLDDVDDRHHRAQPHPRAAVGLLRALHHRAGGAGRLGLGGAAGQRGTAVRQQAVPPVVRRPDRRPPADGGAGRRARPSAQRRVAGRRGLLRRPAHRRR